MSERESSTAASVLLPLVLMLGPGCTGGQTGDGAPANGDNLVGPGIDYGPNNHRGDTASEGGGCEYETEVVEDLDASSELGFGAQAAIDHATRTFETTLGWQASEQLELGPETGASALTITVTHGDREVRIRRAVVREPDDNNGGEGERPVTADFGGPGFGYCPSAYEIDVELAFRTEGGAFDETFEATLIAATASAATFHQPIDHEALAGSLEVLRTKPEGGVVKQVYIGGTLSPLGTYGSVDGVLEYTHPGDDENGGAVSDVAVGGGGLIASWPANDACNRDYEAGLAIDLGTDLGGHTLADAIELTNDMFPRPMSWHVPLAAPEPAQEPQPDPDRERDPMADPEGDEREPQLAVAEPEFEEVSRTSLSLSAEARGDACARLQGNDWFVTLPVTVDAATEDGAWQGQHAGMLLATVGSEGLARVSVEASQDDIPTERFEMDTGVSGVELEGYDHGRVQLVINVSEDTGRFEILGADVADCVNSPPEPTRDEDGNVVGSQGCRGTDLITLKRGEF